MIASAEDRYGHCVPLRVVAVVNFSPKRIGPLVSEVLVLGAYDEAGEVILLAPDRPVSPGSKIG